MTTSHRSLIAVLLALAACKVSQGPPPAPSQAAAPTTQADTAPTKVPANISHGEAPVGTTNTPPPIDAAAPARTAAPVVKVRFEIKNERLAVDSNVAYEGWTFDGRAPGPVIRVRQGSTVDFTLVNKAPMTHSMDFHAAEIAPSKHYVNVQPGDSLHYQFVARVPGVFL